MIDSLTLTPAEIIEITGYRIASKQLDALHVMGIRAHRRADGSVCVLRTWLAEQPAQEAKCQPRLHSIKAA